MTAQEIIAKVKDQHFPEGSYIVFGSCPMAAVGLRESQDIDLLISTELDTQLLRRGWRRIVSDAGDKQLTHEEFDTHTNWHIGTYDPSLQKLLETAMIIDGVPFGALAEVRHWKVVLGRSKDLADIKLIDKYLAGEQLLS